MDGLDKHYISTCATEDQSLFLLGTAAKNNGETIILIELFI